MNRILRSSLQSCGLLSRRIGSRQLFGNTGMPFLPQRVGNGAPCYRQSCRLSHDSAAAPDASTSLPPAPLPSAQPTINNAFSTAILNIRASAADDVFVEKMAEYLSTVQALPADISADALTVLGKYIDLAVTDTNGDPGTRLRLFQKSNLLFTSSVRAFDGLTGSELVASLAKYGDAGLRKFRVLDKAVVGLDAQGLVNLVQVLVNMKLRWKSVPNPAKNKFWKAIEQNIAQFQPADASVIVNGLASLNIKNLESKNLFQNRVLPMVIARAQGQVQDQTSEAAAELKEIDLAFSTAVLDIRASIESDAVFVEKMAEYLAAVPTIPIMSPEALNVLEQYTDLVMANTNAEECRQARLQLLGKLKGVLLYKSFQRATEGLSSNETAVQVVLYAKVGLAIRAMFDKAVVGLDAQGVCNVVHAMQTIAIVWKKLRGLVKRHLWLSIEQSMAQFQPADASMIVNALASIGVDLNTSDPLQKSALSKLTAQAQGQDIAMVSTASGDNDTARTMEAGIGSRIAASQSDQFDSAAIRDSPADALFNKTVLDIKSSSMNDAAFVAKLSEYLSTVQFIPAVSPEAKKALYRYIAEVVVDITVDCHGRLQLLERLGMDKQDMLLEALIRTTGRLSSNEKAASLARYAKAGLRTSLVFFKSSSGLDAQGVCSWLSAAKTMGMWKQLSSDTRKQIWKSIEQNMPNFRPTDAAMIVESFALLGVTTRAEDSLLLSQLKRIIARAQAPCVNVVHDVSSEAIPSVSVHPAEISAVAINDNGIDLVFSTAVLDIRASNNKCDAVFVEKMAEYLAAVPTIPIMSPEAKCVLRQYTEIVVADTAGDCQARLQLLGAMKIVLLHKSFQRATKGKTSNETAARLVIYAKAGLFGLTGFDRAVVGLDAQGVGNVVQAMQTMGTDWEKLRDFVKRHLWLSIEQSMTQFQPADASMIVNVLASMGVDLNTSDPLQKSALSKLAARAQDQDLAMVSTASDSHDAVQPTGVDVASQLTP